MRVLVFGTNFAPEPTGIGKYTGEMCTWLAARGHEVHVITAPPHYPQWEIAKEYRGRGWWTELIEGVNVHRTPLFVPQATSSTAPNRILMETSFTLSSLRWWLPFFLRRGFDVVVAVSPPLQVAALPWPYQLVRGVPWLLHVQDLQVDAAVRLGMIPEGRISSLLLALEKRLLKSATRVTTITEPMRKRVVEKGARDASLFPNWSDTRFIRPLEPNDAVRAKLGCLPGQVLALYAGNIGEKQGLELVVDAAERLQERVSLRFAIVGAGAARQRLERLARERGLSNLRFVDIVSREELPELLAAGDIHLVIQKREAADLVMPSKLTNILSAGRPSIATADKGTALAEVLEGYGAGIVVPPGDSAELAGVIEELAADPKRRQMMGENARSYAENFLDRDTILMQFEKVLSEVSRGRNV